MDEEFENVTSRLALKQAKRTGSAAPPDRQLIPKRFLQTCCFTFVNFFYIFCSNYDTFHFTTRSKQDLETSISLPTSIIDSDYFLIQTLIPIIHHHRH